MSDDKKNIVEILREANNDDPVCDDDGRPWTYPAHKLAVLCGFRPGVSGQHATVGYLIDKVEAELADARREAYINSKKPLKFVRRLIERHGLDWPEPKEGEGFADYIDRCFIPRPRFEDGEPVPWDSRDVAWEGRPDDCCVNAVSSKGDLVTLSSRSVGSFALMKNGRVKRRPTDVPDADGVPTKVGDTVYHKVTGAAYIVTSVVSPTFIEVRERQGTALKAPARRIRSPTSLPSPSAESTMTRGSRHTGTGNARASATIAPRRSTG